MQSLEAYRDLVTSLARRGRLTAREADLLQQAAFDIGQSHRIEVDVVAARKSIVAHADRAAAAAVELRRRRAEELRHHVRRQGDLRRESERALWEMTRERDRLRGELGASQQALQTTDAVLRNTRQEFREVARRRNELQTSLAELQTTADGLRSAVHQTESELEDVVVQRDLLEVRLQETTADAARDEQALRVLEQQALAREALLAKRKSSVKKTIRHMKSRNAALIRELRELKARNARLQAQVDANGAGAEGTAEARLARTLEHSRRVFANVSDVLSRAGERFVRNALAAELNRIQGDPDAEPALVPPADAPAERVAAAAPTS